MRKRLTPEAKAKIAIEAIKGQLTWSQISSKYKVNQQRINQLKKAAEDNVLRGFSEKTDKALGAAEAKNEELLKMLGEAQLENAWLKKNLNCLPTDFRRSLVDLNTRLSRTRQCELLGLPRSTFYYPPVVVSPEELKLMHLVDQIYTESPFFGARRISDNLKERGHEIGRDRVRTIMRTLGLEAIYPKRNLSKPAPGHKVFPYLLRGKIISRPNEVWRADITYVRLQEGFAYLFAVIDWYSRYVLAWRLSPTLSVDFCVEALLEALTIAIPEYFNVDQGAQFTTPQFYDHILDREIKYSMDGRGRYLDNIFVERLWRTVKYENIFIANYNVVNEACAGLTEYFHFYNTQRNHLALDKMTPLYVYTH
ncbi:MAG: IS3 family transposase [Calothrix sp. SM1_5_4]|nr:IS3 family transposase [Calothrix sp. SM1_5_4]